MALESSKTSDKLIIFDTTLRDGEQSPGVTLSIEEKLEIAKALSRLGVDVCEAGFPVASEGDFEAVTRIAKEVGSLMTGRTTGKPMVICGLARAVPADIQRAFDAVCHAPHYRIHTFLATSDIHLEHKLRITRPECIARAVAAVKFAQKLGCKDIEFSPEDAGRSDQDFLCEVLGAVIKAGATTLNIPDTVGYNTPEEYGAMMAYLIKRTKGSQTVLWSTHCHNDLGLATANTLAGIVNGARQVEVTINGIGERAGNTSLEEVVMTLFVHPSRFPVHHDIDTTRIYTTSQLVTRLTGMVIQPNKAIVGENAFAHESGIHQDGYLKFRQTYEIISPSVVGVPVHALVLGKHSGRNAFKTRLREILQGSVYEDIFNSPESGEQRMEELFVRFKQVADTKKGGASNRDLMALVEENVGAGSLDPFRYKLKSVQVVTGSDVLSTCTMSILTRNKDFVSSDGGEIEEILQMDAAIGHGPVHAIIKVINRITGVRNMLVKYEVKAVTEGEDALGKVIVRVKERDISMDGTIMSPSDSSPSLRTTTLFDPNSISTSSSSSSLHKSPIISSTSKISLFEALKKDDDEAPIFEDSSQNMQKGQNESSLMLSSEHGRLMKEAERTEVSGIGIDHDILVASAKAYLNAINKIIIRRERRLESINRSNGLESEVEVIGGKVSSRPPSKRVQV